MTAPSPPPPPPPAREPPTPRWRWVALLSATAIASYLARVNITVAGASIMRDFALTQPQMGRVFSAFVLGYALLMIPGGALVDRWGTRRTLMVAAAGWTAITLALATVGLGAWSALAVLPVLLGLRFLLGAAEAPTFPAAARGIAHWIPAAAQGRANGFVLAAIGVGSAIAPPLVTLMMVHWGWRWAMAVTAAPAAIVFATWLVARGATDTTCANAGRYCLYRSSVNGTSATLLGMIADSTHQTRQPSPSPDGSKVAFVSDEGDTPVIRVLDVGASSVSTWSVTGAAPSWSPDGSKIAYVAPTFEIRLVNPDGTGDHLLAGGGGYVWSAIGWSPDSQYLIARTVGRLDLIRVSDGLFIPLPFSVGIRVASLH